MKRIAPVLAVLAIAVPALALSIEGEQVDKIQFANQIDGWKHVDERHLLLNQGSARAYLLRLKTQCFHLKFARHVGVTSSNNVIYAGFDYITADGEQCPIESIEQVTPEALELLRS